MCTSPQAARTHARESHGRLPQEPHEGSSTFSWQTALAKRDRGDWTCLQAHRELLKGALNPCLMCKPPALPPRLCRAAPALLIPVCASLSQLRLKAPCAIIRSQGKPLCSAIAVPCLLPRLYLIHLETTFIFSLGSPPALPSHARSPGGISAHLLYLCRCC